MTEHLRHLLPDNDGLFAGGIADRETKADEAEASWLGLQAIYPFHASAGCGLVPQMMPKAGE